MTSESAEGPPAPWPTCAVQGESPCTALLHPDTDALPDHLCLDVFEETLRLLEQELGHPFVTDGYPVFPVAVGQESIRRAIDENGPRAITAAFDGPTAWQALIDAPAPRPWHEALAMDPDEVERARMAGGDAYAERARLCYAGDIGWYKALLRYPPRAPLQGHPDAMAGLVVTRHVDGGTVRLYGLVEKLRGRYWRRGEPVPDRQVGEVLPPLEVQQWLVWGDPSDDDEERARAEPPGDQDYVQAVNVRWGLPEHSNRGLWRFTAPVVVMEAVHGAKVADAAQRLIRWYDHLLLNRIVGVRGRPPGRSLTVERVRRAFASLSAVYEDRYLEGAAESARPTLGDVASSLFTSKDTVSRVLHDAGLKFRDLNP